MGLLLTAGVLIFFRFLSGWSMPCTAGHFVNLERAPFYCLGGLTQIVPSLKVNGKWTGESVGGHRSHS